ncbi:MAG: hypothetical protein ACD_51C00207G0002 [uncultured bacterium]|nr:MAG: hypothetical protein ACD_51C00207G0002 [uncultured bacterium]KKT02732.1 MAG: hypothetical protein UV80_C0002G0199 [Candidatus Peregrinibacteria bacterium GW2011_GWF2_43_17]HAU39757.1 hypothetical protein [Candidatus Peregrinibacteria bacterium]
MKLKPVAAGLALGTFWGVSLALLTVVSVYTGYMNTQLELLINVYPGYAITLKGAGMGFLDGLVDGFCVGWVVVMLYNAFAGSKVTKK